MTNLQLVLQIGFAKKTRQPDASFWYIDEDDKVLALMEDGGSGLPSVHDQVISTKIKKTAIAWVIALPNTDEASSKLDQNLRSGPFPYHVDPWAQRN